MQPYDFLSVTVKLEGIGIYLCLITLCGANCGVLRAWWQTGLLPGAV